MTPFYSKIILIYHQKINMFNALIEKCYSDKFSILSNYDNLSVYTYEEMKIILTTWNHRYTGNDNYFDAEWNDKRTRIKIRYQTNTGAFIQIIEEEWILHKMVFVRH